MARRTPPDEMMMVPRLTDREGFVIVDCTWGTIQPGRAGRSDVPDYVAVKQSATGRVTLTGDVAGEYLISERRPDGTLVLEPETAARASLRRLGATAATKAEFEAFVAENGVLPPDGEG